jgi:hypothetical protein
MEIVKRSDDVKGLVILPRRWVVGRALPGSDATGVSPMTDFETSRKPWPPSSPRIHPASPRAVCKGIVQ